ncbi:MAG: phosphoenolpyruvate synthase/pyruvate phosphate dikinase [Desulfobacterales bacterium]|nr:phosphoenolpyruvate synthase/pyruvate phosphate dikinase [Desulfobacterales bacterium]
MFEKPIIDKKNFNIHNFKVFQELMQFKVREILLVSSLYDAYILEEDGSLATKITNEYIGLNLSQPPRFTCTSSAAEALNLINEKKFDIIITMPNLEDMDAFKLADEIKKAKPDIPVILLTHSVKRSIDIRENRFCPSIDKDFVWTGDSDLLLAIIKNIEDRINVYSDTEKAKVRVLLFIEDSPIYKSMILPILYKIIMKQTQRVLGGGINKEHRLLRMRARPKILIAENFEEAIAFYENFYPYILGVISDTRFPKFCMIDENAGLELCRTIKTKNPAIPILIMSSEPNNQKWAHEIPASFIDKNSENLISQIESFFLDNLGFGDFIFKSPEGKEIERASNLRTLEEKLKYISPELIIFHAERNHFSNWIMGRSEITLASMLRDLTVNDFENIEELRNFIIASIHSLRKWRQRGVIAQFSSENFDADIMNFVKIGESSLGGKARGIAFISSLLRENPEISEKYDNIEIRVPKTLVLCTDIFENFVISNNLKYIASEDIPDEEVALSFLKGKIPDSLKKDLEFFLLQVKYPLSVRSSSLLEDAQFHPYAGLYDTYMLPNNDTSIEIRLEHLINAVKLVFASTYFENPKSFAKSALHSTQEEAMAVIIQELVGDEHSNYFYPAISGSAQSYNFYPIPPIKSEDGVAKIALGFGKTVMDGEKALRFCPKHPQILIQFSSVDDTLKNSQKFFYALKIKNYDFNISLSSSNLEKREIDEANTELPIKILSSTYIHEEHRIRDTFYAKGPKILTFAGILKYNLFPLPEIISDFLELGQKSMGCPIEMEFAVNFSKNKSNRNSFYVLQIRPLGYYEDNFKISITPDDIQKALCYSSHALGNGLIQDIKDIIYVKLDSFSAEATRQITMEISHLNSLITSANLSYLLIGPGRWGTSDSWLGIPVKWKDIYGVKAIIELQNGMLKADASQGSHFFQNITSQGIPYITIVDGSDDFFKLTIIEKETIINETKFLRHVRFKNPLIIKSYGKKSECVIILN